MNGDFVEQRRVHHAVLGQVVDDQVHELDLVGAERLAGEEAGQRLLGGLAVQADQRANEQSESLRLRSWRGSIVLGRADAALDAACAPARPDRPAVSGLFIRSLWIATWSWCARRNAAPWRGTCSKSVPGVRSPGSSTAVSPPISSSKSV